LIIVVKDKRGCRMNVLLRILNVVGFAAVIIANYIAQTRGIVGQTTGEISAKYPTIITPAGYACSIWLLIYAGLACYVVYSLTASGRKEKLVQSVGTYFFISCLLNIGWLILWQMEAIVSSTFMLYALLLCLLVININLNRVVPAPERAATRWFVILPF